MALFGGKGKDGSAPEKAAPGTPPPTPSPAAAPSSASPEPPAPARRTEGGSPHREEGNMANVGKSITIKGDLSGDEDVLVEGKVEGKVQLPQNQLTVGANGTVEAHVEAKTVIITGRVAGDVVATERLEIQATGVVEGDVKAPRLIVEEGAILNGSITMTKKEGVQDAPRPIASAPPPKAATGAPHPSP